MRKEAGHHQNRFRSALLILGIVSGVGCSAHDEATAGQVAKRPPLAVEVAVLAAARLADGIRLTGTLAPKEQA